MFRCQPDSVLQKAQELHQYFLQASGRGTREPLLSPELQTGLNQVRSTARRLCLHPWRARRKPKREARNVICQAGLVHHEIPEIKFVLCFGTERC